MPLRRLLRPTAFAVLTHVSVKDSGNPLIQLDLHRVY